MKKIFLLIVACSILLSACSNPEKEKENGEMRVSPDIVNNPASASGEQRENPLPAFSFEMTNYDFGTINSGDEVKYEFKFKNSGNADLIISQVKGSCGCTTPEYTQDPVKPGDEGNIKVTFRSAGMAGQIVKDITILANTQPTTKVLTISGEVIQKNIKEAQ
ncbi:MAG: DUF1573 domain-containing protein [Bacteroidetes bacterium]|nr:DUF1573 domain-containing protein [Bacteroidota bacterium]